MANKKVDEKYYLTNCESTAENQATTHYIQLVCLRLHCFPLSCCVVVAADCKRHDPPVVWNLYVEEEHVDARVDKETY